MRHALARMVSQSNTEDECALAIARYEGWKGADRPSEGHLENFRRRMWQTLRSYSDRKFDADWQLIILRIVIYHDGEDLVTPLVAETVYEARREAEEGHGTMRKVKPRRARHVA